ncbi:GntR family transcriptional regulator [Aurantimonas sp. Leaf443]|uniref:GntR family transcriptional regulator n=1 Tax=Aurantimonas sp. Leaf443 TaxID=1736378 RepID=UPI0006FD9083|nr:GntR family transcriptional regulator [Aurantimonas sp. Leaf443]KQT84113.1 GntR family transcriptional regulator [Aurantimonas sp. Leaf443]
MSDAKEAVLPAAARRKAGPERRRLTSAGLIYETLLSEIVSLELPPGTPLQEKMLLERFQVSRTPVREALIRLAEMGLVDVFPQSGTFVSRVPVNAIPEAVLVRKALEAITVEAAARSGDPRCGLRLDTIVQRQRIAAEHGELGLFHEADEAFHAEIAAIAGHPGIWRLLMQVKVQIDRARRLTLPALGRMRSVMAEHQEIRDAIVRGDAAAARAAMDLHLVAVLPDVAQLRDRFPTYFA